METHFLLAFNEANGTWMQPNIFFWDQSQSFQQVSEQSIYQTGEIIHRIITFLAHAENSKLNDKKKKNHSNLHLS